MSILNLVVIPCEYLIESYMHLGRPPFGQREKNEKDIVILFVIIEKKYIIVFRYMEKIIYFLFPFSQLVQVVDT
jgi:hypothetical protein